MQALDEGYLINANKLNHKKCRYIPIYFVGKEKKSKT